MSGMQSTMSTPMCSPCYPQYYSTVIPCVSERPVGHKKEKRKYRCRKRSPATIERAKVVRRDKANARERRRMNCLNDALEQLREILPHMPDEPKMTKIETLRSAQGYIQLLSQILAENPQTSLDCANRMHTQENYKSFYCYPQS